MTKRLYIDIIGRDKTKQALNQVQGNLTDVKKSVFNLKNALIGLGVGAVLKSFVNVGKEVESLQVRFKFLFGSLEEGAIAFDNLTKFAARVPFSLDEISRASGNLAVVAKDANDLNRILEITGNVAAVTGLDFETTASQIQRAFSGGIGAADLFRERGVRALLGFKAGANVTAKETIKRFEELFSGSGQFAKATRDLANTLEGTLSMIGDKYFKFQKDVANEFFDELKKEFGDLNVFLEENADDIKEIAEGIGTALAQAIILLGKAVKLTGATFTYLNRPINEVSYDLFGMDKIVQMLRDNFPDATDAVDDFVDSLLGIKPKVYEEQIDTIIKANERLINSRSKLDINKIIENAEKLIKERQRLIEINKAYSIVNTELRGYNAGLQDNSKLIAELNEQKMPRFYQTLKEAGDITIQLDGLFTNTFNSFADTLADSIMTGKFAFKDFARSVISDIAKIIARQQALLIIQKATGFFGGAGGTAGGITSSIGKIFGFAEGGMPPVNRPSLVGEKGPELFLPKSSGTIIPNDELPRMSGTTNINFTINTVDARGVDELLTNRRSTIINVINDALNRQGKEALV